VRRRAEPRAGDAHLASHGSLAFVPLPGRQAGPCRVTLASLRTPAVRATLVCVTFRCLIVDDSEGYLASAARLLESQGVNVVGRATSSEVALRLVDALQPEVVLVDVDLGDEDGIELTRYLTAHAPSTRVVLISAHDWEELDELVLDSGAAGFLAKRDLGAAAIDTLIAS
jgi:two-component system, NarL family, nitrate/nitrite response regulator NarL